MNLFEDLVADLQKENLLDEGVYTGDYSFSSNLSKVETISNPVFKEISGFYDGSAVKMSRVKEVFPAPSTPSLILNEESLSPPTDYVAKLPLLPEKPRKVRKVHLKAKKKGRYCKNCMISVPLYRLRCRFCDKKVAGGGFYYLLTFLSIIALLAVFFIIISNKTYN